jgi:hypothetical protein
MWQLPCQDFVKGKPFEMSIFWQWRKKAGARWAKHFT